MKSFVLAVIIASLPLEIQAQSGVWSFLENGPDTRDVGNSRHDDVVFIDANTGWIANLGGKIYKTSDSGASWNLQLDAAGTYAFRSISFTGEQIGFAGTLFTPEDVLLETRDGGQTWINITTRISGTKPEALCGLWSVDENVTVGVGAFFGAPTFIRTSDGGESWTGLDMSPWAAVLIDVYFFDELTGIALGGTGKNFDGDAVVLRTTDGGSTWRIVHRTNRESGIHGEWGWKLTFPTRDVGYASIEYSTNDESRPAKVLKTVDGGLTWSELGIAGSTQRLGLQGIGFVTPDTGWASGRGTTSVTIDGGQTWTQIADYSPTTHTGQLDGKVNRIFTVSDTLAFAVGRRVYRFSGHVSSTAIQGQTELPRSFRIEQNYPNPFSQQTTIDYELFRPSDVRIEIYSLKGRHVRRLFRGFQPSGSYSVLWDGKNESGQPVSSGNYFYLIDMGDGAELKRMVVYR